MSRFEVPAPPAAAFEKKPEAYPLPKKAKRRAVLLDEAFLKRVYRANCWFAVVLALTAGAVGQNFGTALSSGLGSLTGILFLKTQELFVARWLRSKTGQPGKNEWRFLPTWLIVPGKYAVLIAAILLLRRAGLMNYLTFAGGCLSVQLIMLTMAMGRLGSRRSADGKAATMLREIYVAPHKIKK
jgi:hypothetical protein